MKKIKIGIDIDDCICNTLEMDLACAMFKYKKYDGIDKSYYDVTSSFDMKDGDNFYKQEKQFIIKHTSMYPKIFVKEVFEKLKSKNFEIIIITTRDNKFWNGNAYKYAKKWLKKYKIPYDKLFANAFDKNIILQQENIDLLIEDNSLHASNANNIGVKSILIKTSYNHSYSHPLNQFAENWLHVYSILSKIYNFKDNDIIEFN